MFRVKKMLNHWSSHQLITQEQVQKIIEYERTRSRGLWILQGFLILGVVTVAIGIISLIAANWDIIPNDFKLLTNFLFLISLAVGSYFVSQQNKPILFEVCLVFFMILCLASIGLISQIYHTGGEFYEALFLWSIMTFGIFIISNGLFTSFLWTAGFLPGISLTILNFPTFSREDSFIIMAMPLFSGVLAFIFKNREKQTKAFKIWTIIMGISALIYLEFLNSITRSPFIFINYFLATCLWLSIFIDPLYKKIQKILFTLVLILYLIFFHFPLLNVQTSIVYGIQSISILIVSAMFFASLRQRKLFQFFLITTGIRFLVLYFQAFGGLVTTGLNLILSGIIIISMVTLWYKYHNKISLWTERIIAR